MARVAVAYVEVRPDLDKFNRHLREALAKTNPQIVLGVDKGALGKAEATITTAQERLQNKLASSKATHDARMAALNDKMLKSETDEMLALQRDALNQRLAQERENRKLQAADVDMLVAEQKAALRERTRFTAAENDELVALNKQMINQQIKDEDAASALRRTAARAAQAELITDRRKQIDETFRQERVAAKLRESLAAMSVKNTEKMRLRIENEAVVQRISDERAAAKVVARFSAEDFAKEYTKVFRSRFRKITQDESREFERQMVARFGAVGTQVAKRTIRDMDRAGKKAGQRFGDSFFEQARLGINLKLGRLGAILGLVAVTAAPLAKVITSLAAGVSALAVAAGHAAAAVGIGFVTALGALAQAGGVARLAVEGMGDALKQQTNIFQKAAAGIEVTEADLRNYTEQMARLSPAARQVVTALGQVSGQFVTIRRNIQERLFAGLGAQIQTLAAQYLPMLNTQFGKTAGVLATVGAGLTAYAGRASTVERVNAIMAGNTGIVQTLGRAIVPLVDSALRLWRAFQPLGQTLAQYVSAWAEATNRTVTAAQQSGSLADTVSRLSDAMLQALRIGGNVFGALKATFSGLLGPGQTMLTMFENLTAKWSAWASSIAGQNAITAWAQDAIPVLSAIGRLIGDAFRMFGRLAKAGDAATFVDQLRAILPPLEQLLTQLSASNAAGAFAEAIAHVAQAFADINAGGALANMITLIGDLLTGIINFVTWVPGGTAVIGGLINMLTIMAALRFVATVTGILGIVSALTKMGGLITVITNTTLAMKGLEAVGAGAALGGALKAAIGIASASLLRLRIDLAMTAMEMRLAQGAAATLAVGIRGVTTAIMTNPIGLLLVGIASIATAIWSISSASSGAEANTVKLNAALAKTGAVNVAAEVAADLEVLNRAAGGAAEDMLKYGRVVDEATAKNMAAAREYRQVSDAATEMSEVYGRNSEVIVQSLRGMGLQATTSAGEVMVAMSNVIAANNGVPISAEQMQVALAQIYGLTAKNYGAAGDAMTSVSNQIMLGFDNISDAALDAAETQIVAYNLGLKAAGQAASDEYKINQGRLKAIADYRKTRPKPETLAPSGAALGNAYGNAIKQAQPAAKQAARRAGAQTAAGWITSFNAQISDLKAEDLLGKSSKWTDVGDNIARYLAKGITSGAKNINNVAAFIAKNFGRTYVKQIQAEITKYRDALTVYDPITGKKQGKEFWEDRLSEIQDFKSNAYDALTAGVDLVGHFGFIPTPGEVKDRLTALYDQMTGFTSDLASLQEKGLDKDLAKAWLEAGYDSAGNLVEGLKDATPEQIREISNQFRKTTTAAKTTADQQATKYYNIGETQVQKIIDGINSKTATAVTNINTLLDKATNAAKTKLNWKKLGEDAMASFNTGLSTGGAGTAGALRTAVSGLSGATVQSKFTGLGESSMAGYIAGLKKKKTAVAKALVEILENTTKGGYIVLKAGSPSRVYQDMGVDTMQGYINGVQKMGASTVSAVGTLMGKASAVGGATLGSPGYVNRLGANGVGAAGAPVVNVKVYLGTKDITDIVRTEVQVADNTRARQLLAGRRGG